MSFELLRVNGKKVLKTIERAGVDERDLVQAFYLVEDNYVIRFYGCFFDGLSNSGDCKEYNNNIINFIKNIKNLD